MELDKKIQKPQTDLVQAVLEAQEKRNPERVDMLVTNAIKQLKMSRFKPDLTTCLGLIYLARINPRVFQQSNAIKELLKSMIRRDNGPANIKVKSDTALPVLAANILLACCDSSEVRQLILQKIEQWLGSSPKVSEIIQHLLATLCMKCQGDQQTIAFLIEIRSHWLHYLDCNFEAYGLVPSDLCASVRKLLHSDTSCESLVMYLRFLIKHDANIDCLTSEVSQFIIERPISLYILLKENELGAQLNQMILKIFIKLFNFLKSSPKQPAPPSCRLSNSLVQMDVDSQQPPTTTDTKIDPSPLPTTVNPPEKQQQPPAASVIIKLEPKDPDEKPTIEVVPARKTCIKDETKPEPPKPMLDQELPNKKAPSQQTTTDLPSCKGDSINNLDSTTNKSSDDENSSETKLVRMLYVKLPNCDQVIALGRPTIEAALVLLTLVEDEMKDENDRMEEYDELMNCLLSQGKMQQIATIYEDYAQSALYDLPDKLRQRLVQSSNDLLVDLGLQGASVGQLVKLLQLFGTPVKTLNKILKRLESIKEIELIRTEIKDFSYFNQLIEFYSEMGASGVRELQGRLEQVVI